MFITSSLVTSLGRWERPGMVFELKSFNLKFFFSSLLDPCHYRFNIWCSGESITPHQCVCAFCLLLVLVLASHAVIFRGLVLQGSYTSPLKMTAWEAILVLASRGFSPGYSTFPLS